jgi:TIGR03009 family protein
MKPLAVALAAVLIAGSAARAQSDAKAQPPAAPAPEMSAKNKQFLDAYLKAWEDRMAKVDGLETKCVLTEITQDAGRQVKRVYTGDAAILKPNHAKLFLKLADAPADHKRWKHFVADGKFLWEYDYGAKVARVEQLPKEGVGDNLIMAFLFMGKAANLQKRFDLSIDVDDNEKHNDNYLHIQIKPKMKDDMLEFNKAELVLWKNNKDPKFADQWMLPARLWFQNANKDQIMWEFKNLTTKAKLLPADFQAPKFPEKEWKSEWRRAPAQPIVPTGGSSGKPSGKQ